MRAKNFVVNRGISCVNRGISCVNRGVSCFIRCILSCFIRCNPVFQSWSSRRERAKKKATSPSVQLTSTTLLVCQGLLDKLSEGMSTTKYCSTNSSC